MDGFSDRNLLNQISPPRSRPRAPHNGGEVLDVLVRKRRNMKARWNYWRNQRYLPDAIATDGLASYQAAIKVQVTLIYPH